MLREVRPGIRLVLLSNELEKQKALTFPTERSVNLFLQTDFVIQYKISMTSISADPEIL